MCRAYSMLDGRRLSPRSLVMILTAAAAVLPSGRTDWFTTAFSSGANLGVVVSLYGIICVSKSEKER
jgi:hypothetical protein